MSKPHVDVPLCAGCGTCCRLVVELAVGDDVPEQFVVHRDGVSCMDQHGDGTCVALDRATKLCTIYDYRPQVCRTLSAGAACVVRCWRGTRERERAADGGGLSADS